GKQSGTLNAYNVAKQSTSEINQGVISQPILSPDAKRVMYVEFNDVGNDTLWVSNLDGTRKTKVANLPTLGTGDWSWDNEWVGFETAGPKGRGYIGKTDGSKMNSLPDVGKPI